MSKLDEIVYFKMNPRRNAVALFKMGTTPEESKLELSIQFRKLCENKLSSPAIIVIGEVVETVKERAGFIKLKSNHNTILV
jgi:siroheme synthase